MINEIEITSWTSINGNGVVGRILITMVVFLLAVGLVGFIIWRKKHQKTKIWFIPIGLNTKKYENNYWHFSKRDVIFKTDFKWWFFVSLGFFIYWFGGVFIVSLVMLGQYNEFVVNHANDGYSFEWIDTLGTTNGLKGRFVILIDGEWDKSTLGFVLSQTNISFNMNNLYNELAVEGKTIGQINVELNVWLHSFLYSRILFTALCQFLGMAFPISILFSYKKDYASLVAPWALLGGSITVFGGVAGDANIYLTWQFVFYDQQMFFLYHSFLMVMGFSWFTYSNRISLKKWVYYMIFITIYIIYVLITVNVFDIQYYTTAMTGNDLRTAGSYGIVTDAFGESIKFPANAVIMIIIFLAIDWILITIKNYVHFYGYWKNVSKNESFKNDVQYLYQKYFKLRKTS